MTLIELSKAHNWNIPAVCPLCKSNIILSDNHKQMYCSNFKCDGYSSGRIAKYVETLGIKEFGPAVIKTMMELGFKNISDLYNSNLYAKLETIDGYGKRSVEKKLAEVNNHKNVTLVQFVAGYNIDSIGEKVIEKIFKHANVKTFEDACKLATDECICEGVGEITAKKFYDGFRMLQSDMMKTIENITIKTDEPVVTGGSLAGMSFCFTGAASRPRKELQAMAVNAGGIVHDSVKKDTTYLVLADPNSTSTKAEKAKKNGTKLLSEEDFVKLSGN